LECEFNESTALGTLFGEATIHPDGLLLPDGTKYKIRIHPPDEDNMAPMPKAGMVEEPPIQIEKIPFKDYSKEKK